MRPDTLQLWDITQISDCRIGGSANEAVKRIVAKWFERGLHGNLLLLIGEAILDRE